MSRRQTLRLLAGLGLVPFVPVRLRGAVGSGAGTSEQWATGGTASMTDKATYPDPFAGGVETCAIVAATTQGPCTTDNDLLREEISEGWTGLPVRLAIRVVDTACNPLSGVTVKVWHTNLEGSYSGQTPNNNMCLQQQAYATQNFFRGVQTTDADGTVFFDTCFPGWYRGRAVHIHFQVKTSAQSYRISQLFFPEEITTDVFANHSEYVGFGQPDTDFASDNILSAIPAADRERLILDIARMTDGAMLASKTVTVVDEGVVPTATAATPAVPTATPTTSSSGECSGDCDGGGTVSVDELIRGVNISLGNADLATCTAFDGDGSASITIDELIEAVSASLDGCGTS